MTHKELKKLLQKAGICKWTGWNIRLFDTKHADVTFSDMNRRVKEAKGFLVSEGFEWAEEGLDCDNFSLLYMAEVMKLWALEHKGMRSYPTYPFGRAHMKGHDTNIGVADGKIYFWDYGELKYFDPKTIDEVEFR